MGDFELGRAVFAFAVEAAVVMALLGGIAILGDESFSGILVSYGIPLAGASFVGAYLAGRGFFSSRG